MKWIKTPQLLMVIVLLLSSSFTIHASNLPEKLLNLPITLISGKVVTLKQYQGKQPVYLKFWATWCQPCRKEMPHFEDINQQYGKKMAVIAINLAINDTLADVLNIKKEFALTMPIAMDKHGDLAQNFRLLGTPYHLLFDKQINLVHVGNEANSVLDNKIALLNQNSSLDLLAGSIIEETESPLKLTLDDGKTHALFFTATWCDWYFIDSRPNASRQCIKAQKNINKLSETYQNIAWQGIISRLWTGTNELSNYLKKYQVKYPTTIDNNNQLFHHYAIKNFPTLVIVKEGKVLFETSDFANVDKLKTQIASLNSSKAVKSD